MFYCIMWVLIDISRQTIKNMCILYGTFFVKILKRQYTHTRISIINTFFFKDFNHIFLIV